MAKQENESLDVFLSRLKPSNLETAARSLISIANPHVGDWPSSDVDPFNLEGQTLLDKCEAREEQLGDAEDCDSGSVSRRRRSLERSILGLAKQTYIVEGKWMVYPPSNLVDAAWERAARATFEGRLGYGAKVSRVNREGKEGFATWVQTEDFGDQEDVKRVLRELQSLQLFRHPPFRWNIYYKTDAYTHLGLYHGNAYGLKTSLYSSSAMYKQIQKERSRGTGA
jgi:hypothetical protein